MLFVEKNNIDIIKESYEQENDKYILKDIDKNKKEQLKNALLNAEISVTMIESDSEAIKEGLKKLNIENKEKREGHSRRNRKRRSHRGQNNRQEAEGYVEVDTDRKARAVPESSVQGRR